MKDSIFTKIIKGEMPCYKIYEDDKTLAFLDIQPIQPGQVLVVPKKQISFVWDLPDEDYQALMQTVKLVGRRIREVYISKDRVGVMIEGLDVDNHAHIKVFPFSNDTEYRAHPKRGDEVDHAELAEIAEKLRFDA